MTSCSLQVRGDSVADRSCKSTRGLIGERLDTAAKGDLNMGTVLNIVSQRPKEKKKLKILEIKKETETKEHITILAQFWFAS